jgi:non-ribosomal peptide synthetase component F
MCIPAYLDGPTETTIWSSSFTLPKDVTTLQTTNGVPIIPIGMPISEVCRYLSCSYRVL